MKYPQKRAVVVEEQACTFAELHQRTQRLAGGLLKLGLCKGDKVALLMLNRIEFSEIYFGVLRCGGILVALNARLKGQELSYMIQHSEARVLIFEDSFGEEVKKIQSQIHQVKDLIMVGETIPQRFVSYQDLILDSHTGDSQIEVGDDDEACILYTSGTTGAPKGVVITHKNIFIEAINHIVEWDVRFEDVELYPIPLFHAGGLAALSRTVVIGNTLLLMKSFDPERFIEIIDREKVTRTGLVSTMCAFILDLPRLDTHKACSLRLMIIGGSILPIEIKKKMMELFPRVGIYETYGQTETTGSIACLKPVDALRKPGSIGKVFFLNEIRLVDEQDNEVSPGEVGELVVRGPNVMKNYYKNPQATAEVLKGVWFHTGDLARQDEDGYLYLVDRKKDMIVSGGVNIYPREIEEVLYAHPKILEAAVIGVADPVMKETVKAIVVLKSGEKVGEKEVIDFCRERLAGYKNPRAVDFVRSLPKNPAGKILKSELRQKNDSLLQYGMKNQKED
jgi:acyl-CoA synthetase (AMP-forming)/AMP-acid ligase II